MRRVIVPVIVAAMLAGCGASEDPAAGSTVAPPPAVLAAIPSGETVVASMAAVDPSASDQPTAEDALNAGLAMIVARDVCRFSTADLGRFSAYSEWVVKNDPRRKALFISAANEARKLHEAVIRQGRQEAYRQETCPKVRRLLSMIGQSGKARLGADAP